jgi:hypothetical protein
VTIAARHRTDYERDRADRPVTELLKTTDCNNPKQHGKSSPASYLRRRGQPV